MSGPSLSNRLISVVPLATVIACAGLVVADGVVSHLTPGYDAVSETSSQLMSPGARLSPLMRLALGLYAVLLVPFALAMVYGFSGRGRVRRPPPVLAAGSIWAHILAATVAALAVNDSEELLLAGYTANEVHDAAAKAMFAAALAAVVGVTSGYGSAGAGLRRFTHFVAAAMLLAGAIFLLRLLPQYDGIVERVLAASFLLWLPVVAIAMHRSARLPEPAEAESLVATSP